MADDMMTMPLETEAADQKQSFETMIGDLEQIVRRMESGQAGLEESVELFKRGTLLCKACDDYLKQAETVVQQLVVGDDGQLETQPFDAASARSGS